MNWFTNMMVGRSVYYSRLFVCVFDQVTIRPVPQGSWQVQYIQLWTEFDIPSVPTRWAQIEVLSLYSATLVYTEIQEIEFYVGSSK